MNKLCPRLLPLVTSLFLSLWLVCLSTTIASAGGWYLLKPHVRDNFDEDEFLKTHPNLKSSEHGTLRQILPEYMGDWEAPLSTWSHEGSFDTAAQCEAARQKLIEWEKSREPENRREYPQGFPTLMSTLARESRCIASDDPRLNR
jgi:hypothetical protein